MNLEYTKFWITQKIPDRLFVIIWDFRPEMYLLGETSSQIGHELDDRARAELVEEYFSR